MNHSLKKRITVAVIFALALAYLEAVAGVVVLIPLMFSVINGNKNNYLL